MKRKVWVLIDSRTGSNGQARGIVKVLNWDSEEKQIDYNRWAGLPNFLIGASLLGVTRSSRKTLSEPFPDLVISASRRSAAVARWIKKKSGGKTKIIQIMHPGNTGLSDFDRIFVSKHDQHKKHSPNIVYVYGSAHRVTPDSLEAAKQKWLANFVSLPRPLTAVIVGGSIKSRSFSIENARELGRQVKDLKQKEGGSILITTSRRTGDKAQNALMQELSGIPAYTYLWGVDQGENPFLGFLACADDVVVTGDSVSMCSEACGSGKRVMIFRGEDWLTPKHQRFVKSFFAKGFAYPLEDIPSGKEKYQYYNAADEICVEIKKMFGEEV